MLVNIQTTHGVAESSSERIFDDLSSNRTRAVSLTLSVRFWYFASRHSNPYRRSSVVLSAREPTQSTHEEPAGLDSTAVSRGPREMQYNGIESHNQKRAPAVGDVGVRIGQPAQRATAAQPVQNSIVSPYLAERWRSNKLEFPVLRRRRRCGERIDPNTL